MTVRALHLYTDPYPQRRDWLDMSLPDRLGQRLQTWLAARVTGWQRLRTGFAQAVKTEQDRLSTLDSVALAQALVEIRYALRRHGLTKDVVLTRAFALIRLQSLRLLGMQHYDNQIEAARIMLKGHVIELDTGEGKTLTASLAAAAAALAGLHVHVVTVNDYLAQRDFEQLSALYAALGLRVGSVLESSTPEQRVQAYQCDITYCANKTVVFDYLRDRVMLGDRLQPLRLSFDRWLGRSRQTHLTGLQFAIVDEADSVFIDEARTPLILSRQTQDKALEAFYQQAVELARALQVAKDYVWHANQRRAQLSQTGRKTLRELVSTGAHWSPLWLGQRRREEIVTQALQALHAFDRDVHYIVREGKVLIVDENTGRTMPDRSWERGLHQLIEIKEGVPISPEKETLARISYQLFFRRYLLLSGMSGTCREVATELGEVYGLPVRRVAPHRPSQRRYLGTRLFARADARWDAVLATVQQRVAAGQAVLVGTRSIRASEILSARLAAAGVAHQVLNAKQDEDEAHRIEQAGTTGAVTIATNMAGRGTDIKLDPAVRAAGGLHVILTERHDNQRVDRQLVGRSARQGDPGSWQALLSLEDELVMHWAPGLVGPVRDWLARVPDSRMAQALGLLCYGMAQWAVNRGHWQIRQALLRSDFRTRQAMSFSGQME